MSGAFYEMDHLGRRVNRRTMTREIGPRRNVDGHFSRKLELLVRRPCQQRDHQVFQSDHANAKLYQFRHSQLGNPRLAFAGCQDFSRLAVSYAAWAFPPGSRQFALF